MRNHGVDVKAARPNRFHGFVTAHASSVTFPFLATTPCARLDSRAPWNLCEDFLTRLVVQTWRRIESEKANCRGGRKPIMIRWRWTKEFCFGVAVLLAATGRANAADVQKFPLIDAAGLAAHNVKFETVIYQGRKAIRMTTVTQGDDAGFALLPGTDFQDGTIEADIAVKVTRPPGARTPGFIGIAFRAKPDGSEYELFYVRPKNALSENQSMRNHSVQYCAEPNYGWYKLRREWPFVYESYAEIEPETWTKVKIEVSGRTARIFLNGSDKPSLVVDGLKSSNLHGTIGLWGYAGEESYFSNLRITPAAPQPVRNGSEAKGTWDVKVSSDAIGFQTSMKLTRDGNQLSGILEAGPGEKIPITGTWRDGYVELSFPFDWPAGGDGAPGPTKAFMDGWIDGDGAKGRVRVEGRADGMWLAQRIAE